MGGAGEVKVSEVRDTSAIDFAFPKGLSFFDPYLQYSIKEVLEVGGEAYVSKDPKGEISGVFIYDDYEKTGTVYTRSKEVFDYFYDLKPSNLLWSELKTEHECETFDIYSVDLEKFPFAHRFRHEITVDEKEHAQEIERFMILAHPGINRGWTKVAFENGDKCFTVRLNNQIAGLGWLSLVNGIGRLDSLFVRPQFRRMGIGEDLLYARLLWLKSKRARSTFCEISRDNPPASKIHTKGHMTVTGQVFQYFRDASRQ
jgi:ribosomal protein S18 acetylase RimI-like enzyme